MSWRSQNREIRGLLISGANSGCASAQQQLIDSQWHSLLLSHLAKTDGPIVYTGGSG